MPNAGLDASPRTANRGPDAPLLPCLALAAIVWLTVCGCGRREFYPVSGRLVGSDGAALVELAGTLIIFESMDGKISSQGNIEPDGSFRMGALTAVGGMRPGTYRVMIAPPPPLHDDIDTVASPPPRIVAPRYHSFATSGWEVTVEPKHNAFTFTAERATGDRNR